MEKTQRIMGFDSLKGLAIIAVVYYHLFPQVVPGGFLLVNTFLVLSGYFVAGKLEQILESGESVREKVKTYLVSTIERLFFPLLWMMVFIVVGLLLIHPIVLRSIRSDMLTSLFFVNNIYQIITEQSYFVQMTSASPFTHLWYNALYVQSFLITIPLIILTDKLKWKTTAKAIGWTLIILLSHSLVFYLYEPGADPSRVYYGIDTRFAAFAAGITLHYLQRVFKPKFSTEGFSGYLLNSLAFLSFMGMMVLTILVRDSWDTTYLVWTPFFTMLSMLIIHLIKRRVTFFEKLFNQPILALMGQRSYTYYLWYYPVIVFYMSFLRQLNGNILLINFLSIVTLAILGEVMYRIFERREVVIAYGLSFDFKKEWQASKEHQRFGSKALLYWGSMAAVTLFMGLFIVGIIYSADNKSLAQFDLERQFFQVSPNIQNEPMVEERYMTEANEDFKQIDDWFDTKIFNRPETFNLQQEWFALSRNPLSDNLELGEQVSQNQSLLTEMIELNPEVTALLEPSEILGAAEVPVTFFGDSLIYITAPDSLNLFKQGNAYGYGSLQIYDAPPLMADLLDQGVIHENVVINLGTNASLEQEAMDELIAMLGDRSIFFVNTNSAVMHVEEVNRIIKETAAKYDNVYEIDWYSLQQGHDDWYTWDEVHHSPEGKNQFTALVARELYKVLGNQMFLEE